MGDWAQVKANFDFCAQCHEIKICQRSVANILQLLQSAFETSTLLLESLEGIHCIFSFSSDSYFCKRHLLCT